MTHKFRKGGYVIEYNFEPVYGTFKDIKIEMTYRIPKKILKNLTDPKVKAEFIQAMDSLRQEHRNLHAQVSTNTGVWYRQPNKKGKNVIPADCRLGRVLVQIRCQCYNDTTLLTLSNLLSKIKNKAKEWEV